MEVWRDRVALVTGASSGIGAAIAVALADAGMQVVAVARRVELVEALAQKVTGSGKLYARRCDVSQHEDISQLFHYVKQTYGGVDLMVNNAAMFSPGTFTSSDPEKEVSMADLDMMFNVNVRATIAFTKLAVDSMRERNSNGHIVFINSIAGQYIVGTGQLSETGAYPATKYAVTALAEIARREFSFTNLGIRTTSISPGAVDTEMVRKLPDVPLDMPMLNSEDIAAAVVYAVSAPQHVNVQEITIHATGERL